MITVRKKPRFAVFLLALLLTGCAMRSYREDSSPPASELLTVYQAQVAIGECAFKPKPEGAVMAAIATVLATSAISQGVNYLGKAIEEAAKDTNDRVTATRNVEVTDKTFGPCIQILRGWFYRGFKGDNESMNTFTEAMGTWAKASEGKAIDPDKLTLLWQRRIWPAAQPDFIFEAEIVPATLIPDNQLHNQLLTLAPVYARLDNPISMAGLRPSTAREVAVFLAFHDADKDPVAPGNAAGGMIIGRLAAGADRQFPPAKSDTENTPNRDPNESKWFKLAIGKSKKPMTITALVTEHQDAQPFLQFVADVFGKAKDPIAAELQNALVPSMREKAEESETAMNEAARNAYEDALVNALDAAASCAAGVTDPVATANGVRSKVRALNKAARALGNSQFEEDDVPLSTDTAKVQSGCSELKNKLLKAVS